MGCISSVVSTVLEALEQSQQQQQPTGVVPPSGAAPPSQPHPSHDNQLPSPHPAPIQPPGSHLAPEHHTDKFGHEVDNINGGRVWSEAYYRARKEADQHYQEKHRCSEESQKAYSRGDKKEAKRLSDEAHKYTAMMDKANEVAVQEILGPQHLSTAKAIDLHGLHVHEAEEATRKFVESKMGGQQRPSTVEVIVGKGIHSDKQKGAVIRPAIEELCRKENWKVHHDDNNAGVLIISAPSSD